MATERKYLDFEGLRYFWTIIKKQFYKGVTGKNSNGVTTTIYAEGNGNNPALLQFESSGTATVTVSKDNSTKNTVVTIGASNVSPAPTESVPAKNSGSGSAGTSLNYARQDHVHPTSIVEGKCATVANQHCYGYSQKYIECHFSPKSSTTCHSITINNNKITEGDASCLGSDAEYLAPTWAAMNSCLAAIRSEASTATAVKDCNPTLAWGKTCEVATIGNCTIHVTMPANPNTDTKVTSAANHYTPTTVPDQNKSASATGATAAWNIDVVQGVTLNTDGKGHVTGISVTSGKVPTPSDTKVQMIEVCSTQCIEYPLIFGPDKSHIISGSCYTGNYSSVVYNPKLDDISVTNVNGNYIGATNIVASCAGNSNQIPTTAAIISYVNGVVSGAAAFQGALPASSASVTNYSAGYYWLVPSDGCYSNYCLGILEGGDQVYATVGATTYNKNNFTVIQTNMNRLNCANIDCATR